ncbi:MAG: hypothetical protein ACRD3T_18220 [Terriglobia bacterium]
MIIIKSILAGLVALVVVALLLIIGVLIAGILTATRGPTIGIDPVSIMRSFPGYWVMPIIVFSLGFFWEYKRVKFRQAKLKPGSDKH